MHFSKSHALTALALVASAANADQNPDGTVTTIYDVKSLSTPAPPVETPKTQTRTTYVTETSSVINVVTVCAGDFCHETPIVTSAPPVETSKTQTRTTYVTETSSVINVATVCAGDFCHEKPAATSSVVPVPESSAPPTHVVGSSAPPAKSSSPIIKPFVPTFSKATLSSSAHASSAHHKPTATSTSEGNKGGSNVAPTSAPTSSDISANPGSKLIIPSLASLGGLALAMFYLA